MGIAFDGASMWIANATDGTVIKLSASDGAPQGVVKLNPFSAITAKPIGVAFDGVYIHVLDSANNEDNKL